MPFGPWLFYAFDVKIVPESTPETFVVRLVLGAFLILATVWAYRRGTDTLREISMPATSMEVGQPGDCGEWPALGSKNPTRQSSRPGCEPSAPVG